MNKKNFISRVSAEFSIYHFLNSDICDFIACQFALESDFGESYLALHCNNFCGMKMPKKRVTTAFLNSNEFAEYISLSSCVEDYILWLLYARPSRIALSSLDAFKSWLRVSGYCPEPLYIERISQIYKQYFK